MEKEPEFSSDLFGEHLRQAQRFAADLAREGEKRGLIGPLELPRLWSRHLVNSALLAELLRPGIVADIGSGAGLPGLVLALMRPDCEFVLIEPMERRTDWLREEADALGLNNVIVERSRAEDAPWIEKIDQVTARAVSALRTLIPLAVPLLKPGGELILMKGASVAAEIEAAEKVLRKSRISDYQVITLGEDWGAEPTRVFRATVG